MKLLASIAILLCLTSATLCAQDIPAEAKVVLDAPNSCRIGELVRLDASESTATNFKWLLIPDSVDFEVYDEGRRAVFSARAAGTFLFVISVTKNDTIDMIKHTIRVVGPPPTPVTDSLADWIPFWAWNYVLPKEECDAVALNFEVVSSRDDLKTPQDWIRVTAKMNRDTLGDRLEVWKPLLDKIGVALANKANNGTLETAADHAQVWLEIADGLRKCGEV